MFVRIYPHPENDHILIFFGEKLLILVEVLISSF